ncbi:hypothetical protein [Candidatus Enterococcus clewellii]|uniref:PPM-type phosphatase domain-containing protein n=1 Tax=Candidatus Enterococcus clewellii TaxID=1834193 RepID=A0A242KD92_9ENTE|nr:hypothetical protein [Enterococcus sp. 9E7_DIV0242]OTP19039.1 hypothetical protein A5888_000853 [Enterococcus sp. 9E7_DIV0242]
MMKLNDPLVLLVSLIGLLLLLRIWLARIQHKKMVGAGRSIQSQESVDVTTFVENEQGFLAFLTAGVGPTGVGDQSSQLAEKIILDFFEKKESFEAPQDFIKRCFLESHKKISEHSNAQSGGCSLGLVYITNQKLYWASSGNISIYLNREKLTRLNQRDLYKYRLREKILSGQISENRVQGNTLRNELTSYLGFENLKKIEMSQQAISLKRRDQLFLCNHQVDELLSQIEKEALLNQSKKLTEIVVDIQLSLQKKHNKTEPVKFLAIEKFRWFS